MPIYLYRCKKCGEVFEYLSMSATEKPKCGKCGNQNLEKLPTAFGIRMGESGSGSCPTGTCSLPK